MSLRCLPFVSIIAVASACTKEPVAADPPSTPADKSDTQTPTKTSVARAGLMTPGERANLGEPAPDFTLTDLDGNPVQLSTYRGKTVVLEWFNPQCPFVVKAHTKGSLVDAATRHGENGVAWLAINSGAPGKQGHGVEVNRSAKATFGLSHPVLLDESGEVGRSYGATNTPHLFVIDASGVLVYRGAIDNSPDGERQSPEGGELRNHVDAALADLAQGRPVATTETKAYGCSVKYAKP